MLINVNENFFVGLLIQLNRINLSKASLFQVEDKSNHNQNFSFLKQVETVAISPFNKTKVCTCALEKFAHLTCAIVYSRCKVTSFSIVQNLTKV